MIKHTFLLRMSYKFDSKKLVFRSPTTMRKVEVKQEQHSKRFAELSTEKWFPKKKNPVKM